MNPGDMFVVGFVAGMFVGVVIVMTAYLVVVRERRKS
jgi:hypothetical protein